MRLGISLCIGTAALIGNEDTTAAFQESNETMAAVVTEFSPSDVAGLVIWFETDAGVATSGGNGTSWTDRASAFSAAQGTVGKQPAYTAIDADFNNKPSLSGTVAGATQLTNTGDTPFSAGQTRTMFFVFKLAGVPGTNIGYQLMDSRHAATARPEWIFGDLGGQAWTYTDGAAINQTIPPPASYTAKHYLSEIWESGVVSKVWLDGVSQTVSGGSPTLDVAAAGFDIFSAQNAARPFEGKLVAILGYTGSLSTPDRQKVEAYLALKWM